MAKKSTDSTGKVIPLRTMEQAIQTTYVGVPSTEAILAGLQKLILHEQSTCRGKELQDRIIPLAEAVSYVETYGDTEGFAQGVHAGRLIMLALARIGLEDIADAGFRQRENVPTTQPLEISSDELLVKFKAMHAKYPNLSHKGLCAKVGEACAPQRKQRTIENKCSEFGITSKSYKNS